MGGPLRKWKFSSLRSTLIRLDTCLPFLMVISIDASKARYLHMNMRSKNLDGLSLIYMNSMVI